MLSVLALTATAYAAPPAAVLLPAATLPATREVSVEGFALGVGGTVCANLETSTCESTFDFAGGPTLRAQVPVHPRVGVDVRAGVLSVAGDTSWVGMATVKGAVVASDAIVVTPWVSAVRLIEDGIVGAAGVSVDAGNDRVRVDLSTPVAVGLFGGGEQELLPLYIPPAFSEFGVRYRVNDHHTVRVGTLSIVAPGVAWQGTWGTTSVDVALHLAPASTPYGRIALTRAM
jgi:hypothetical protein